MQKTVRRVAALACCASMTACYSYVPARTDELVPGEAVRLRISAAEAERLEELRNNFERVVEGVVAGTSGDEVLVDTSVGTLDPARGMRPLTQRLNIALAEVNEVELRRLDQMRTAAAVGGFVLAAGLVIAAAFGSIIGGPGDDREPPVEFRGRIPLGGRR